MAVVWFEESGVDVAVLETGLGGRLDATNVIDEKALCVITRIGLDHTEFLGDSLSKIAWEKAGIMRGGVPVVCFRDNETDEMFNICAKETGAVLSLFDRDCINILGIKDKGVCFKLDGVEYKLSSPALYQAENAALALRGITVSGLCPDISYEKLSAALEKTHWQGRMEEISDGIFLDGAHNEDGIKAFIKTAEVISAARQASHSSLIFAVSSDKDYRTMAGDIIESGLFETIAVTSFEGGRGLDSKTLAEVFREIIDSETLKIPQIIECGRAEDIFRIMISEKGENDMIYVAGSLYLVGEIKKVTEL